MSPDTDDNADWQPTLQGQRITLHPLAAADFDDLYAVARDPLIWEQHPESTRWQRDVFTRFFDGALAGRSELLVRDAETHIVIGSSRWYDWRPQTREVAIGYTFLARSQWGGTVNAELKRLMLAHAFRLVDTVWFHVGTANHRSRRTLEKIGAHYSHTVSNDLSRGGRDTAYYTMTAP